MYPLALIEQIDQRMFNVMDLLQTSASVFEFEWNVFAYIL